MTRLPPVLHRCNSCDDAVSRLAVRLVEIGNRSINEDGCFHLALSGGRTPRALHQLLASDAWRNRMDWSRTKLYFGDERCVPPDHEQSNYRMAYETLIEPLGIAPQQVFRMAGELDPNEAARAYEMLLPIGKGLDLILLGMGDDGHTASLFPGSDALQLRDQRVVAAEVAGKGWRLSLSLGEIQSARQLLFLVCGNDKADALRSVFQPSGDPLLPAALASSNLPAEWFVDTSASALLPT